MSNYTDEQKEKMLEWAEILESGAYKQRRGDWGSDEEGAYCCLSVAHKHFTGKDLPNTPTADRLRSAADLFYQGREWCNQFILMNDRERLTFPQIAANIRNMVA